MKPKIPNPKVFISYARGTQGYNEKVESFCAELKSNGIQVLFDMWSVKPGGDFNSFMESSVNDPSVTNVLVLLNEQYKERANSRQGGVGTEAQILSPEVYKNISSSKIIPILFERNRDGKACAPTYIETRNWIDLDDPERYETNLMRLIKFLYGEKITKEPELGETPDWVVEDEKSVLWISSMKEKSLSIPRAKDYFSRITNDFSTYYNDSKEESSLISPDIFNDDNKKLLVDYLEVLTRLDINDTFIDDFSEFGERCSDFITENINNPMFIESAKYLLNEYAIYTIGWLYKHDMYKEIHTILSKSYFIKKKYSNRPIASIFSDVFYSGTTHPNPIEEYVKAKEKRNIYSVAAVLWTRRIQTKVLSLEEFFSADQLITNITFTLDNFRYPWFPLSYIYGLSNSNVLLKLFERMKSKYQIIKIGFLFGAYSTLEWQKLFDYAIEKYAEFRNRYRYEESFDEPYLFFNELKIDDIASVS